MQNVTEQQNLLVRLVEKFYACGKVSLQPISPYMLEDRRITAAKLSVLEDAVLYDIARRAGLEQQFFTLSDGSSEEIWLQKMLARY